MDNQLTHPEEAESLITLNLRDEFGIFTVTRGFECYPDIGEMTKCFLVPLLQLQGYSNKSIQDLFNGEWDIEL